MKTYGKVHKLASMVNLSLRTINNDNALSFALRNAMPSNKLTRNKRGQFTPLVLATCDVDSFGARDSIELLASIATRNMAR
jgi:hypothetical protein